MMMTEKIQPNDWKKWDKSENQDLCMLKSSLSNLTNHFTNMFRVYLEEMKNIAQETKMIALKYYAVCRYFYVFRNICVTLEKDIALLVNKKDKKMSRAFLTEMACKFVSHHEFVEICQREISHIIEFKDYWASQKKNGVGV